MTALRYYSALFTAAIACLLCTQSILHAQTNVAQSTDESVDVVQKQTPARRRNLKYDGPLARGVVFNDRNRDGIFNDGDWVFVNVKVSNGVEITKTDNNGRYELPISQDQFIFVIKPTGYRTALNDDNLPKFFYTHKPEGSPQLKYAGSKPTGELPRSIDFPLYPQNEPQQFKVILFGDPQPRNMKEVDYITEDVVSELVGQTSAAFGVSLGDLAFDHLETLEPLNQSIAMIGIPWYNVIGNHDLNLDAPTRTQVNETFEAIYGPTYYSFDYGQVHFVVMDNIDWGLVEGRQRFIANFGKQQLAWLRTDLSMIPESQMVVLMMHIPITQAKDSLETYRLIEKRPLCISISGHTHFHQHLFIGKEQGWNGEHPHHHIINVTVSGSWWSGQKDERGIPHTMMADGAPNGYSILTFDELGYHLDFKAAGRPASDQMRIMAADSVTSDATQNSDVWVNVYNGSEKSTVRMTIDDSEEWIELEKKNALDPVYVEIFQREQILTPLPEPKLTRPKPSSHLWNAKLPQSIPPGMHRLRVETVDMHGRKFKAHRLFRVTGEENSNPSK